MAKKSKYDLLHEQRVNEITKKIDDIYAAAVTEAASIGAIVRGFNPDKVFAFSDYPVTRDRVNAMLKQLHNQVVGVVENGCRAEWDLANEKNDELTERLLGPHKETMPKEVLERYYKNNNDAREQFIRRREEVRGETEGLNLSDRVWRYTDQFKQEIELGLDLGLGEGRSADQMSRDLRGYLREPNKLFRRVRDKHGNLVLSKAAKAYHPGRGVYRSSYKNARRLAATETNIAYRSADHIRWNQLDFVVGIRINLSKNHTINGVPFTDICDGLQGLYPKTFKFTGWHPLCRCYPTSVLKTEDELFRDLDGVDRGSENKVEKTPKAFDEYVKKNRDRIAGSASKPYWVLDNFKDGDIDKGLSIYDKYRPKGKQKFKTDEQKEAIRKEWHDRKATRKYGESVLGIMSGISDVPTWQLEKALRGGDMEAILASAKALKGIGKQLSSLEYIDDGIAAAKKYSMNGVVKTNDELRGVMDKWMKKYSYASLDKADLAHLRNKLNFELTSPTITYTHKDIIKDALTEQIRKVNRKIEWNEMVSKVAALKSFKTRSAAYKGYLTRIEGAIKSNDFDALRKAVEDAEKQQQKLMANQIKRGGSAKGALNPEYQGGAVGRDITSSIDVSKMVSEDPYRGTFTNNVARMQGFDAPAKLVSEQEFRQLEQACGEVFYRTVNPTTFKGTDMTSQEFASQLWKADKLELNGPGGRVYGDGMYVATAAWDGSRLNPLNASNKRSAYNGSIAYGHGRHTISEMTFTRAPKIIEQSDLRDEYRKLSAAEKMKFGMNPNTYACALGYDGMYCDGPNYMVIWNRSIIAVKKT